MEARFNERRKMAVLASGNCSDLLLYCARERRKFYMRDNEVKEVIFLRTDDGELRGKGNQVNERSKMT